MSSDRSRLSDYPRNLYAGIVAQQGRVLVDRDINALQDIALTSLAADARDIIGPCGTPDNGFQIALPGTPGDPFYSPPGESPPTGSPPGSPPSGPGTGRDFLIGPGTMYLGGYRAELPLRPNGMPVAYSYEDQLVLPASAAQIFTQEIFQSPEMELVYLDVSLREVSAVEDPDLLDAALGGPDTTQRLRLLPRIERLTVDAADCATAWQQAVANWASQGLIFDPARMTLFPAVKLLAGFTQDAGSGDPCDPIATGGYLGADNQLIRVQIATIDDVLSVAWGFDNASFVYRIASISPDGITLTLAGGPPDSFHTPQTGQLVEILTTASVVAAEPDETALAGSPANILRVAAEAMGAFHTLARSYGPSTQGDPTSTITLTEPLEPNMAGSPLPLFLRVWQNQSAFAFDTPLPLFDQNNRSTGITVTFSNATTPAIGAYWQIAARPATPQGLYPEDLLVTPQLPDGPGRFVCPLAVIDWVADGGATIADCRVEFSNLITLSRRPPGCCTVSIGPADISADISLQALIDRAAARARRVTICFAAGSYALPAPLQLTTAHDGMTFESCGGIAGFIAAPDADATAFASGMIILDNARGLTFRGLTLLAKLVAVPREFLRSVVDTLGTGTTREEALRLLRVPFAGFGIRAIGATELSLEQCTIGFARNAEDVLEVIAAAVFLQGDCAGFSAKQCNFTSTIAPTYHAIPQAVATTGATLEAVPQTQTLVIAAKPPSLVDFSDKAVIGNILTNITAGRAAATQQPSMTATAGILAFTYVQTDTANETVAETNAARTINCNLGDAVLQENRFSGLTFGAVITADFTSLRVRDNIVSGGVGGIWATCSAPVWPDGIGSGQFENTSNIEEYLLLALYAARLSPPANATVNPAAASVTAGIYSTVMVDGNRITTGIHPPPTPDAAGLTTGIPGSSALLLWLNANIESEVLENSCIATLLNNNHFLTASAIAPTALLVLPDSQPCAISGNTLLNMPGPLNQDQRAPSLWVVMSILQKQVAQPLAATGNVLRGISDLNLFNRAQGPTRAGWSGYNADPD